MQQTLAGPLLSATDLVDFLECHHRTNSNIQVVSGRLNKPKNTDDRSAFLATEGLSHERRFLVQLRKEGKSVVEIAPGNGAHILTKNAMDDGIDVIYQASFQNAPWVGHADFLIKTPTGYEVVDTKLATSPRATALIQISNYTAYVARLQGFEPENMHIRTGDNETHSFRVKDFSAIYRRLEGEYLKWLADPQRTYPEPVESCPSCDFLALCSSKWIEDDHLSQLAGINKGLTQKLEAYGIMSVAQLAALRDDEDVHGVDRAALEPFRRQALLQVTKRSMNAPQFELRAPGRPGHGLAALPAPTANDIYFDLEGSPDVTVEGREYLWGWKDVTSQRRERYHQRWALSDAEELKTLETFIDYVTARHAKHPNAHVYHYGAYEQTALRRLTTKYGTRVAELEALIRDNVFIDLLPIMRSSIYTSEGSYSLKALEAHYGFARTGMVAEAGETMTMYQQAVGASRNAEGVISRARLTNRLRPIREYNAADLDSLKEAHAFLERGLTQVIEWGMELDRPELGRPERSSERLAEDKELAATYAALMRDIPSLPASRSEEQQAQWVLAQTLEWHRRESRPEWQEHFRRLEMSPPELFETSGAIGGLRHIEEVPQTVDRSFLHRYRFSTKQEFSIKVGDSVIDPSTKRSAGTVEHIDYQKGVVSLRRGKTSQAPHPRAIVEPAPVDTTAQRAAILALAKSVLVTGIDGPGAYRAARDFLLRRSPSIAGIESGAPLYGQHADGQHAAVWLSRKLAESCLVVQGPPGTGKTTTAAAIVRQAVREGKRVAITASSHRIIAGLIDAVAVGAEVDGESVSIVQRAPSDEVSKAATSAGDNSRVTKAMEAGAQVVGGTSWLFARPEMHDQFDLIVVDEAGRLSLADTLAISGAARDLVLIGDQRQLEQPIVGSHPVGAETSGLEYFARTDAISRDRGVLLDRTFRMAPSIVKGFTSPIMYSGRLRAAALNGRQVVHPADAIGGNGLRFVAVEHKDRVNSSREEAIVIARLYESLLGRAWTSRTGDLHVIGPKDIIVTAATNAQATAIRRAINRIDPALGEAARVGTVDRMQGQEAAVSVYSLAASSPDRVARSFGFAYSRERLNVATSRGRALSFVVGSSRLLSPGLRSAEQMKMANALNAFVEAAVTLNADLQPAPLPDVDNCVATARQWTVGQPPPLLGRELVLA